MESGRATPEAMKRPPHRPAAVSVSCLQNCSAPVAQLQESGLQIPPSTTEQPPPTTKQFQAEQFTNAATIPVQGDTSIPQQDCVVPNLFQTWLGSLAAVQACLLTAFGLGWAVSSRLIRLNLQDWKGRIDSSKSVRSKDMLSDYRTEALGNNETLHSTSTLSIAHDIEKQSIKGPDRPVLKHGVAYVDANSETNCDNGVTAADDRVATHELLRKHFDYLMPWVSNQPCQNGEEEMIFDSSIADELHCMPMQQFKDLSTAIYRDVRRREREPSPSDIYAPQWDQCIRNRQNESRMLLCRTINAQFHRLVMALVLEQARRLTEIRIWLSRRTITAQRGALSPLPN